MKNLFTLGRLAALLPLASPCLVQAQTVGYSDAAFSSGKPGYAVLSFVPGSSRIDNNQVYYVLVNAASNTCAPGAVRISYTVTQAE